MPRVTINGQTQEFTEDTTILHAARSLSIEIPTLCQDDRLKPAGACRLCVVSIKGWPHLRISQAVKPGELFTTFHTAEVFLNNVTSPYRDSYTLTPEYKVTAVRVEKL